MFRRALAQLWNRVGKAKNRLIQLDRAEDFRADVALSQLRLYFSRWLSALEEYPSMYRKSRQFELQSAVRHWNQISVAASKRHKLARWRADVVDNSKLVPSFAPGYNYGASEIKAIGPRSALLGNELH